MDSGETSWFVGHMLAVLLCLDPRFSKSTCQFNIGCSRPNEIVLSSGRRCYDIVMVPSKGIHDSGLTPDTLSRKTNLLHLLTHQSSANYTLLLFTQPSLIDSGLTN